MATRYNATSAAIYAAWSVALGYSALVQLDYTAPFRQPAEGPPTLDKFNETMTASAARLNGASGGRNVGLRVTPGGDPLLAAEVYYHGNYDLYPRKVYAGDADHVINGADDFVGPFPDRSTLDRLNVGGVVGYPDDGR